MVSCSSSMHEPHTPGQTGGVLEHWGESVTQTRSMPKRQKVCLSLEGARFETQSAPLDRASGLTVAHSHDQSGSGLMKHVPEAISRCASKVKRFKSVQLASAECARQPVSESVSR